MRKVESKGNISLEPPHVFIHATMSKNSFLINQLGVYFFGRGVFCLKMVCVEL